MQSFSPADWYTVNVVDGELGDLSLFQGKRVYLPGLSQFELNKGCGPVALTSDSGTTFSLGLDAEVLRNIQHQIEQLLVVNSLEEFPGILTKLP